MIDKEKFFNKAMDTDSFVVYIYDLKEKKNVWCSEAIYKMFGRTKENIKELGETLLPTVMHPDDFKNYLENIYPKYFELKDNEKIEYSYRMANVKTGEWVWVKSVESILEFDAKGNPIKIVGNIIDITDVKKSQERLLNIINNLEDIFVVFEYNPVKELISNMKWKKCGGCLSKLQTDLDMHLKNVYETGTKLEVRDYELSKDDFYNLLIYKYNGGLAVLGRQIKTTPSQLSQMLSHALAKLDATLKGIEKID